MNIIQAWLVPLALLIVTVEKPIFGQDSAPNPIDSFVGTWKMPAVISSGRVSKTLHQQAIFEKDRVVFKHVGEADETWSFTVDAATSPKQISMIRVGGIPDPETGKPQEINAIYVHTGKEFRIALLLGRNGSSLKERPKDVTSTDTNKTLVFIFTRE